MTLAMWKRLKTELDHIAENADDRLVIVKGAGTTSFCSGNDVSEYARCRTTPEQIQTYNETVDNACQRLQLFAKPTIAAINGACIGGGLHLALLCDLRICVDTAVFAIPSAKLGLPYRHSGVKTLLAVVPPACIREMLLTGDKFDSSFALRWGLVNRCVTRPAFEAEIAKVATDIATNAPLTHRCTKKALEELVHAENPDLASVEAAETACYESEDYREGVASFRAKRPPVFQGH